MRVDPVEENDVQRLLVMLDDERVVAKIIEKLAPRSFASLKNDRDQKS